MSASHHRSGGLLVACLATCSLAALAFTFLPGGDEPVIPPTAAAHDNGGAQARATSARTERDAGALQRVAAAEPATTAGTPTAASTGCASVVVEDYLHRPSAGVQVILTDNSRDPEQLGLAISQADSGVATFDDVTLADLGERGARAYLNVLAAAPVAAILTDKHTAPPVLTLPATGRLTVRIEPELAAGGGFVNVGCATSEVVLAAALEKRTAVTFEHIAVGLPLIVRVIRPYPLAHCEVQVPGPSNVGAHPIVDIGLADAVSAPAPPQSISEFTVHVTDPAGRPASGVHVRAHGTASSSSDAAWTDGEGRAVLSRFGRAEPVQLQILNPRWQATPARSVPLGCDEFAIALVEGGVLTGCAEPRRLASRDDLRWLLLRSEGNEALPTTAAGAWLRQAPTADGSFRFEGLRPGLYALTAVAAGDRRPLFAARWIRIEESLQPVTIPTIGLGKAVRPVSFTITDDAGTSLDGATTTLLDRLGAATPPTDCDGSFERLVALDRSHVAIACDGYRTQVHLLDSLPERIRMRTALEIQVDLTAMAQAGTSRDDVQFVARPRDALDPIAFGTVRSSIQGNRAIVQLPGPGTYQVRIGSRRATVAIDGHHPVLVARMRGEQLELTE